jgi:predicted AAA+ superfamily ATPase
VLEATFVAHVVRPFSTHRPTEIVAAPKVFAFDTGFVCYLRGCYELHAEDLGTLWEHLVLNEMQANLQTREVNCWRDKRGHEVDFVYVRRGQQPDTIECKWTTDEFRPRNLQAFRRQYPEGHNWVVATDIDQEYARRYRNVEVRFVSLSKLIEHLMASPAHLKSGGEMSVGDPITKLL